MTLPRQISDLNLTEKLFLKLWCFPPPLAPYEPRDSYDLSLLPSMGPDPLARTRLVFGDRLESCLPGRVFLDIGCGPGDQVIGAAQAGAREAVGIDKIEIGLRIGETNAASLGVDARVRFTTEPLTTLGEGWADVALSQNSFEHLEEPAAVLRDVYHALKPGGQFFVTFGPPWWHPFGVHHMFMIKLPWAHLVFSERTILRVRQLFRPNEPACWNDVALNRMTIAKLERLVEDSLFTLTDMILTPIGPLPKRLVGLRAFREWTTANVSVVLTKSAS